CPSCDQYWPTPPDLHSLPTRRSSDLYADAASRCRRAAADHTLERAAERLRGYLAEALPSAPIGANPARPLKVVVAGHDHLEGTRSEEHTSELQSRFDLVCRLLLEKKK